MNCGGYQIGSEIVCLSTGSGEVPINSTYLFKPPSMDILQASPLYDLDAIRRYPGPKMPMEDEYRKCELDYAAALANALEPNSFDAVVCVPVHGRFYNGLTAKRS